jgi:hypothetical protein
MQRLACGKLHLGFACGDPSTTLNHHKHNITSAAKRAVCAARRDCELGDLRDVIREDCATKHTL